MHDSSLKFFKCPRCGSTLDVIILWQTAEIDEGFLDCNTCSLRFPIIGKIPILWDDFARYISERVILGGRLFQMAKHSSMREFLKSSLLSKSKISLDRTLLEDRWSGIYQQSRKSRFYSVIRQEIDSIGSSGIALEYGSSVGIMSGYLSSVHSRVFGMDRSFAALSVAKKSWMPNVDFAVADFMSMAFGKMRFNLVLALNVLELVEPMPFLQQVSEHVRRGGYMILSDPYDFERGKHRVSILDSKTVRSSLRNLGLSIRKNTKEPSYISWNLRINERAKLMYKNDLVISKMR